MSDVGPKHRVPLTSEEAVLRETLRLTKRHAARRGHEFALSDEQALELFRQPCVYCGGTDYRCDKRKCASVNGIDRVDNSKAYVLSNVVSCCYVCNASKKDLSIEKWYGWRLSVSKHLEKSQERLQKLSEGYRGE